MFYAYNCALDIAFVVDGTFSPAEWTTIRRFMVMFTERFYVSAALTRFALVQFSQNSQTTFSFAQYATNAALRASLQNAQQQATGTVRELAGTLNFTYYCNFLLDGRASAGWVGIILSLDGRGVGQNEEGKCHKLCPLIHEMFVKMICTCIVINFICVCFKQNLSN